MNDSKTLLGQWHDKWPCITIRFLRRTEVPQPTDKWSEITNLIPYSPLCYLYPSNRWFSYTLEIYTTQSFSLPHCSFVHLKIGFPFCGRDYNCTTSHNYHPRDVIKSGRSEIRSRVLHTHNPQKYFPEPTVRLLIPSVGRWSTTFCRTLQSRPSRHLSIRTWRE